MAALGTEGERSIVLLSDGGDTVAALEGGAAGARKGRRAAVDALLKAKVRAEVVAFKSPEANGEVLRAFAKAGGGSVATAENRAAVAEAFDAAAVTPRVPGPRVMGPAGRPRRGPGDHRAGRGGRRRFSLAPR